MDEELLRHDRVLRSCLRTGKHWNLSELFKVMHKVLGDVAAEVLYQFLVIALVQVHRFQQLQTVINQLL